MGDGGHAILMQSMADNSSCLGQSSFFWHELTCCQCVCAACMLDGAEAACYITSHPGIHIFLWLHREPRFCWQCPAWHFRSTSNTEYAQADVKRGQPWNEEGVCELSFCLQPVTLRHSHHGSVSDGFGRIIAELGPVSGPSPSQRQARPLGKDAWLEPAGCFSDRARNV